MGIFGKGRSDGYLVEDIEPINHLMPYIMRGRNESVVYYQQTIEIDNIQEYIRSKRKDGVRITLLSFVVTALLHVLYQRPGINRFVAGRRLYQHKVTDVSYVVKKSFTDSSPESVARVVLNKHDNIFDVTKLMYEHVKEIRKEEDDSIHDSLSSFMRWISKFPRWSLRSFVSLLRWLDFHGMLPNSLQEIIPMYSSIFISHLGSLGAEAPFHHLYEFGTTSIFMTIGKIYDKPVKVNDNQMEWRKCVDLKFSIDERICDGYYLVRSLRLLEKLLSQPELLEYSPVELERKMEKEHEVKELERNARRLKRARENQNSWPDVEDYEEDDLD